MEAVASAAYPGLLFSFHLRALTTLSATIFSTPNLKNGNVPPTQPLVETSFYIHCEHERPDD